MWADCCILLHTAVGQYHQLSTHLAVRQVQMHSCTLHAHTACFHSIRVLRQCIAVGSVDGGMHEHSHGVGITFTHHARDS